MERTSKISPIAKEIAQHLLNIRSIQFNVENPFTWASGIKSPIYCDNRKINSDVEVRRIVVNAFVNLIKDTFPDVEIISGVATGGIPLGVLIADRMNLPFIYVRQEAKKHGLMKQVEGYFEAGSKVVLIEDLISTGSSSLNAVHGLLNVNLNFLGLISIMTYNFESSINLFIKEKINHYSICDLDTILVVATTNGFLTNEAKRIILEFRQSPGTWK